MDDRILINIDANEIRNVLTISKCIDVMEDLFRNDSEAIASVPSRILVRIDPESLFLTMPSHSARLGRSAVKIVSEYQANPARYGLPVQGGIVILMDREHPNGLALLDAAEITALRTGAVSGLATKILARKDCEKVAVIGSGAQAATQLEAVCAVRPIESAKVFSRDYSHAKSFADGTARRLGIEIEAVSDRSLATRGADIIILATNSYQPVISWHEIPKGCHINSIGLLTDRRELDPATICNSALFVEYRQGVLSEAGDIIDAIKSGEISNEHIRADLSELVRGLHSGRSNSTEVTLFKSVGFALEDVYASSFVFDHYSNH